MTREACTPRIGSIALRVAEHASVHLLGESVFQLQFEGLALPVYGEAVFPLAPPHMPLAAKLPVRRDMPPAEVAFRAEVRLRFECAVQHAVGRHKEREVPAGEDRKHLHGVCVEGVAGQLGA
jgi:hypothetical protein